jgi:hypothetical protein
MQDIEHADDLILGYHYSSGENLSVRYAYSVSDEMILLAIGRGNAYQAFTGGSPGGGSPGGGSGGGDTTPPASQFYARFPTVPSFGASSANAFFLGEGLAQDLGLVDDDYILYGDQIYVYSLPSSSFIPDTDRYDDLLLARGFEIISMNRYDDRGEFVAYFENENEGIDVIYVYDYDLEILYVAIGLW